MSVSEVANIWLFQDKSHIYSLITKSFKQFIQIIQDSLLLFQNQKTWGEKGITMEILIVIGGGFWPTYAGIWHHTNPEESSPALSNRPITKDRFIIPYTKIYMYLDESRSKTSAAVSETEILIDLVKCVFNTSSVRLRHTKYHDLERVELAI